MLLTVILVAVTLWLIEAKENECVTPNGEAANCISIYECPVLFEALKSDDSSVKEFGQKSKCGYDRGPMVCCGSSADFTSISKTDQITSLLPTRQYCGLQHADDYVQTTRGINGSSLINEFPWLVVLRYSTNAGEQILCSGSLINDRHVLTAAHCIHIRPKAILIGVRLGEYNIEQSIDCVSDGNLDECSDPIHDFSVENIIIHPEFDSYYHQNDIALLRLNRTVEYTDYIRPICLPLPGAPRANVGDTLTGSGWGRLKTGQSSNIKKKIYTTLFANEVCASRYKNRSNVRITDKHMCTKETVPNVKPVCVGDSGGPVMFSHKNQWIQEGIISFGAGCGAGNPDVNTRVSSYVDWILKTIK